MLFHSEIQNPQSAIENFRLPNSGSLSPQSSLLSPDLFSDFRIFSRGIVPPYRTTTGPTSNFNNICPLPTAYCLLPSAFCLPPSAYCLLPTALRPPPSAFRPLPPAPCFELCSWDSLAFKPPGLLAFQLYPFFAIAIAILSSAFSSRLLGHPKLSRTKPGASNSIPSCNPTPASSKKAAGFLTPLCRISIQAR